MIFLFQISLLVGALNTTWLFIDSLAKTLAIQFLFGGKIEKLHTTEFALTQFVDRYKQSIKTLNRCFILNVGFAVLALYAYFVVPEGSNIKLPFLNLDVSSKGWISLCPLISYGLQLYIFIAIAWFLLIRRGLDLLKTELVEVDYFGDVANIMLTGFVGFLWLILNVYRYFETKWHYIWYLPAVFLLLIVILSPIILCGYFIIKLFQAQEIFLPFIYLILFVPSLALSLLLVTVAGVLGLGEIQRS